tara:strand:+ start:250 stop:675 length:426 start_codon:yes stop_codon:yes gene_type:complete
LNKKISDRDKEVWENFVKSKKKLEDKDLKLTNKKFSYTEKTIDLHGYTLENANLEIEKFINLCFDEGVTKINIITGRGSRSNNKNNPYKSKDLSILKYSVPNFLKENKNLMKKILKMDLESVNNISMGSFEIILKKKNDQK